MAPVISKPLFAIAHRMAGQEFENGGVEPRDAFTWRYFGGVNPQSGLPPMHQELIGGENRIRVKLGLHASVFEPRPAF
jgi:hypothetical protein